MKGTDLARTVIALLVGGAIAFPAGMMVASRNEEQAIARPLQRTAQVRDAFSPSIANDPYFLDQQRLGVEALENHCRTAGQMCSEARQARGKLAELEAAAN